MGKEGKEDVDHKENWEMRLSVGQGGEWDGGDTLAGGEVNGGELEELEDSSPSEDIRKG